MLSLTDSFITQTQNRLIIKEWKICFMQTNQENQSGYTNIKQNRLKIKIWYKQQERRQYVILKRVKHSRIYNNYKYKLPPKLSPKIYEAKIDN